VRKGRSWWNGITKAVLTAGGLAAAVGSILALWPAADAQDSARFLSVRVTPHVPFSEYRQRALTLTPQGDAQGAQQQQRLATRLVSETTVAAANAESSQPVSPALSAATTPATGATPSAGSTSDSVIPPPSGTNSPTSTAASPTPDTTTPSTQLSSDAPAGPPTATGTTHIGSPDAAKAKAFGPDCLAKGTCTFAYIVKVQSATDANGEPVPPDVAAQRTLQVLGQTRTIATPPDSAKPTGTPSSKKRTPQVEPLGVVVRADLELSGLREKTVALSWSIWQESGRDRLSGPWLNQIFCYRLTPTSDSDTGSLDLWVPLPKAHARYFIRLNMIYSGTSLASADTAAFD
jgi:hypothetical protein